MYNQDMNTEKNASALRVGDRIRTLAVDATVIRTTVLATGTRVVYRADCCDNLHTVDVPDDYPYTLA